MSSFYVVGCEKENAHEFTIFLRNEIKSFIQQTDAAFYNLKTLWKAEASAELLKKNARVILPYNTDTTCAYLGFFNVTDWDALYAKLFISKTDESGDYNNAYYTVSHLKALLKQLIHHSMNNDSGNSLYDFMIEYRNEQINTSDRVCTLEINIHSSSFDTFDFFKCLIYKLDAFYPGVFLSAYVDDTCVIHSDFKFDIEMLTKKIITTTKSFYVSDKLKIINNHLDTAFLPHYGISRLRHGTWFTLYDRYTREDYPPRQRWDFLIPQYMLVNWSDLTKQNGLHPTDFDMVSVYYDKYSPTDPMLIFSRGYLPAQLNYIANEHGDFVLMEQYPAALLLDAL